MANNIELFTSCVPLLDEVYKEASLTGVLDGAPELAQSGAGTDELIIPMMEMSGLADYSRAGGYVQGDVVLTQQTVRCNFDRGRMFSVDTLDDAETAGIAFGRLSGEFIRTRVVPELDAFRLAKYASFDGVQVTAGALSTGEDVVEALRACVTHMDDREVPYDGRVLFILPGLRGDAVRPPGKRRRGMAPGRGPAGQPAAAGLPAVPVPDRRAGAGVHRTAGGLPSGRDGRGRGRPVPGAPRL